MELEDEGLFKCEVTYLDLLSPRCRVVQLWRLTTSAPPSSLVILQRPHLGQDTVEVTHGYIPAVNQGSSVSLVCQVWHYNPKCFNHADPFLQVGGGKPAPSIVWRLGNEADKCQRTFIFLKLLLAFLSLKCTRIPEMHSFWSLFLPVSHRSN